MIYSNRSTVATILVNIPSLTSMTVREGTLHITIVRFPDGTNATLIARFNREIWNSVVFLSRSSHTFSGRRIFGLKETPCLKNEY